MMTNKGDVYGRIGFDAEMQQSTTLSVRPTRVEAKLEDQNSGFSGIRSAIFKFSGFKFSLSMRTKGTNTVLTEQCEPDSNPKWVFPSEGDEDFYADKVPHIKTAVSFETMMDLSLQLLVWRHTSDNQFLHAECWLGFAKLFAEERQAMY